MQCGVGLWLCWHGSFPRTGTAPSRNHSGDSVGTLLHRGRSPVPVVQIVPAASSLCAARAGPAQGAVSPHGPAEMGLAPGISVSLRGTGRGAAGSGEPGAPPCPAGAAGVPTCPAEPGGAGTGQR